MRFEFKKRVKGQIEFGIIYGGIVLVALGAVLLLPVLSIAPSCVFRTLTGLPCPTCGSTRSMVCLVHGDLSGALMMNPLTTLTLIAAVLFFLYSLFTLVFGLPRASLVLTKGEGNAVRFGAVIILIAQWIYLLMLLG